MNKSIIKFVVFVLLTIPVISIAQIQFETNSNTKSSVIEKDTEPLNNNKKSFPKNIVSLKMGADDPWFGITYERLFSQHIGTEVQIGLIGASLGAKLYFPATRSGRINFHIGVLPGWGFMGGLKTYFPIGVNLLTKNNFRISIDAGPRIWHGEGEENFLGFSIKVGKAF
jgi:hypothetical protein